FRTPLAWALYLAAAVGLVASAAWLSSHLQRRENERLERVVAERTGELHATNVQLGSQIEETTKKSTELSVSEERFRLLNAELENRVEERTAKLAETHQQLVDASRRAGMAEVATGVLHNVGNVLNSVNVSATVVIDRVRRTKAANIGKVASLLEQNKGRLAEFMTEDPRGRTLPSYLGSLAEALAAEHQEEIQELQHLHKNIEHIKDIVSMQQSFARSSGVTEMVAVADMAEDALRMNADSLAGHGVETVCDFQINPILALDRHKVLQILVNLIGNAKQACKDSDRTDKRVIVRIAGDDRRVTIAVSDNGVGIPPGKPHADFQSRFHDQERRPRLRPAQRRARRQGARRIAPRGKRGSGSRRDFHPGTGGPTRNQIRPQDRGHPAHRLSFFRHESFECPLVILASAGAEALRRRRKYSTGIFSTARLLAAPVRWRLP
ncbi:MAG: ATP-binding protein, partial [Opitutaceae bacterium]